MKIPNKIYKQTLPCTPFGILYPALACGDRMHTYFENGYEGIICLFQGSLMTNYMNEEHMKLCAEEFLAKKEMPQEWQEEFEIDKQHILRICLDIKKASIKKLGTEELEELYKELDTWTLKMWTISIFIDSLDPGYDIREIQRISKENNLSQKEVEVLLTPRTTPYFSAFEEQLDAYHKGKTTTEKILEEYYWLNTTYEGYKEFTANNLKEIAKNNKGCEWKNPEKEQKNILQEKGLHKNPLEQLSITTEWRDERKKLCYMSLHAFYTLLREAFSRAGVDKELSHQIGSPQEAREAIQGTINVEELKKRKKKSTITCQGMEATIATGKEADKIEQQLQQAQRDTLEEISGITASKGKATGKVRIVRRITHTFLQGEILVTSMTRPEHVPLMRRAAAIVTDEGGITSHAAIVSRELGIPCVIGTKIATSILKEGEFIEVNANHGIIRKVKKNE